jgi:hypothetical protein
MEILLKAPCISIACLSIEKSATVTECARSFISFILNRRSTISGAPKAAREHLDGFRSPHARKTTRRDISDGTNASAASILETERAMKKEIALHTQTESIMQCQQANRGARESSGSMERGLFAWKPLGMALHININHAHLETAKNKAKLENVRTREREPNPKGMLRNVAGRTIVLYVHLLNFKCHGNPDARNDHAYSI